MSKPRRGPGFVYLMHAKGTDLYKIGLSVNPEKRALKLSYESPYEIVLIHKILVVGMREVELYFHRIFQRRNVKNEWFRLTRFEVDMICKLKADNADEILIEVVHEHKYYDYLREERKQG